MLQFIPLVLALLICQDSKKSAVPPDDELVAPGLPDGDVPPLPERVNWDMTQAITAKTTARERVDLAGLWRFAAVLEHETPVVRSEMGWLQIPGKATNDESGIYDSRFRAADGLWRGKPLEEHPYFWAERDISITNADALKWLDHRIFLVLRGPWAKAEIYTSQRIPARPKNEADAEVKPEVHIHVELVTGFEQHGFHWCDITEQLIYPGTTQISMRLKRDVASSEGRSAAKPVASYVGLELWPPGPRVDSIRLRRDADRGAIEATFDLLRPKGFMMFPAPPIRTIAMTLKLRLDDVETDQTMQKLDHNFGTMPDHTRTVTVRIPWSAAKDQPPPQKARLRVRLTPTDGGMFDEPFPIEFKPAELMPARFP